VVTVDLARNFGHRKAMMTGLAHATDGVTGATAISSRSQNCYRVSRSA
jgi:hypothetical protein